MQHKKTSPQNIDLADLPELTEQQRNFVFLLLQGKSASDAYRAAYDCTNSQDRTIWCEASKLKHHPRVAIWLSAARQAEMGTAKVTLEQHIKRLDRLEELCIGSGNLGAAVQAEQLIGKASGHYKETVDLSISNDPLAALKELASISPDIAKQLAAAHGIQWTDDSEPQATAH
jgi:hypothetical protein